MTDVALRLALKKYHLDSFGWAMHCCSHQREMAKEVLQIVYLKILDKKAIYHGKSQFKTWLFSVIKLTSLDLFQKRNKRHQKYTFTDNLARFDQPIEAISLEDELDKQFFETALATLSHRQRELMHLVFYQGWSINEAADLMNISGGSARQHYHRAKIQLEKWFLKHKGVGKK